MVEIPYQQLTKIIEQGEIPLIVITKSDENDLETGQSLSLQVTSLSKSRKHYTAISHVWAHGLGNPVQNALPHCQIRRIQQYLLDASSFTAVGNLFWMDTLCIPVKHADQHLKMQAIHQMAKIYSRAWTVLVLDADLMQYKCKDHIDNELLARILCCTCNFRSWTFQEAKLARRCIFRFANSLLLVEPFSNHEAQFKLIVVSTNQGYGTFDSILVDSNRESASSSAWPMPRNQSTRGTLEALRTAKLEKNLQARLLEILVHPCRLREPFHYTTPHDEQPQLDADLFMMIWNTLAVRSTTMVADLYHIFANTAAIRSEPLLEVETLEEKLHCIFLSFESLPSSLLFVPRQDAPTYGSERNTCLPSGMERHILRDGPILRVKYTKTPQLTLKLGECEGSSFKIDAYIAPIPEHQIRDCSLSLRDGDYEYTLECLPSAPQSVHSAGNMMCVLIGKPYQTSGEDLRATCFSVLHHTRRNRYSVALHCRVRLRLQLTENLDEMSATQARHLVLKGEKLPKQTILSIQCDLRPGLANDKLRRHGEYVSPAWLIILLILWIFLFILQLLQAPLPGYREEMPTSAIASCFSMFTWICFTTHLRGVADWEYIERYGRRGVLRVRRVGGLAAL